MDLISNCGISVKASFRIMIHVLVAQEGPDRTMWHFRQGFLQKYCSKLFGKLCVNSEIERFRQGFLQNYHFLLIWDAHQLPQQRGHGALPCHLQCCGVISSFSRTGATFQINFRLNFGVLCSLQTTAQKPTNSKIEHFGQGFLQKYCRKPKKRRLNSQNRAFPQPIHSAPKP